ncbi:DUF3343 domain-containing protein [Oceanirhabdus seepicola]|uniref:DUF3343 domain-containing protein n=1 Tax=Oceanirhabdus seepicola TaxID=2828781 RepID=A0A9J6NXY7_9CLOT|nr:DUF3343 domain-containing protein [Oceanirhabdus seepicola]MCM1989314.1 DUF3343 domain-containing protein [Oceanirhabdus seepicola]
MINEVEYIVILASNNYASLLYKKLLGRKCKITFISAPRSIARSCKKAIKFYKRDLNIVKQEIKNNKLKSKGIYKIEIKNKKINYVLVG